MRIGHYEPGWVLKYMTRRIWLLAWPVVAEMLCLVVGGISTTAMVGRFGPVEVASVGLATMMQVTCSMIISAAGSGAGSLVARAFGARQLEEARQIAGQALVMAVTAGTCAAFLCYFVGRELIALASPDQEVIRMASGFLAVMACFLPFTSVISVCLGTVRATGQTKVAMLVAVVGQTISLSVTYSLLFVFKIGIYGAIFGMASSQALVAVMGFFAARSSLTLGLRLRHILPLRREVISNVLKISMSNGSEQVAIQMGRISFALLMATAGAAQFAGHNVALQIESISFMPGLAFGIAAMNLVSYNLGRGLPHRARQYAWLTTGICVAVMGFLGVLFYFFAEFLTVVFIDHAEVLAWGAGCVRIAAMDQIGLALCTALAGVLRGTGDAVTSMYIAVFGTWCIRLPAIFFLKYLGEFDVVAGWLCAFLDMSVRGLLLLYIVRTKDWSKVKTGVYL